MQHNSLIITNQLYPVTSDGYARSRPAFNKQITATFLNGYSTREIPCSNQKSKHSLLVVKHISGLKTINLSISACNALFIDW
jgi:hypothetical protein